MPRALLPVLLAFAVTSSATAQQPAPSRPVPNINGGLPAVSPTGRHVAFVSYRGGKRAVLVMPAEGGEAVTLIEGEGGGGVGWTADGEEVLTSVFGNDTSRLLAIRPSGGTPRAIAARPGREVALSPDGQRLLYMAGRFPSVRLMVSHLDGSGEHDLSDPRALMTFNAAWSPDGRRIAYTRVDSARRLEVWVMDADGTGAHRVSRIPDGEGNPQWPAWAPDGRRLAIQVGKYEGRNSAANTSHIWVLELASGAATKLAAHDRPYLDETPAWFPDGRIAFQSDRTGRMEVWVMHADGTGARQLTR